MFCVKSQDSWHRVVRSLVVSTGFNHLNHLIPYHRKQTTYLVGGWPTPLNNISQLGLLFPIYGKVKHVPNHQPVINISTLLQFMTLAGPNLDHLVNISIDGSNVPGMANSLGPLWEHQSSATGPLRIVQHPNFQLYAPLWMANLSIIVAPSFSQP